MARVVRLTLTDDLQYRIAFARLCADRAPADRDRAKLALADAVLAAVQAPRISRLARLDGLRLRPAQVVVELELRPKRRRA